MPTEARFIEMAIDLERHRDAMLALAGDLERLVPVDMLQAGVSKRVFDARGHIANNAQVSGYHLDALSQLCRQRAVACHEYTQEYRRYQRRFREYSDDMARTAGPAWNPPRPPARPGPWADRG